MKKCFKCGVCCEFIAFGANLEQIKADKNFPDRDFILEHWKPKEPPPIKLNPNVSDKCWNGWFWFTCDLFDSITRLCIDYDNRPQICQNYPGNRENINSSLITEKCGFFEVNKNGL